MDTSRLESGFVALALGTSILWPVTLFGVNLGITDILLITAGVSYVVRTWSYPILSTSLLSASFVFLCIAAVSLLFTPRPLAGVLDFAQYGLIFAITIPIAAAAFTNQRTRRYAVAAYLVSIHAIGVAVLVQFKTGNLKPVLFYGNFNQPFWLLATGALIHAGIALDHATASSVRALSAVGAGYLAVLVFLGPAETALIALVAGGWLYGIPLARTHSTRAVRGYLAVTAAVAASAVVASVAFWPTIRQIGFSHRLPMYQAALELGVQSPLLGRGLGSSVTVLSVLPPGIARSVHNFLLHYFLELGVLGLLAFLWILMAWWRSAVLPVLARDRTRLVVPAAVFAGYLAVAFFQPPPVRRIWWLFFAMSWGVALAPHIREDAMEAASG